MNSRFQGLLFAVVAITLVSASSAFGQHRVYRQSYHTDHAMRYSDNSIPHDSYHIISRSNGHNHGNYYVRNGEYYYIPRTTTGHQHYMPQQVVFGSFSHVDELASRLETLANRLCLDLHYNYSHNPDFRETYREAYQLYQVAGYVHAAEHQNDRRAIQEELRGLDQLVHHLLDDVRGWSRHHHRSFGHVGISSQLTMIESTLHHLINDVGVKPTSVRQQAEVEQAPAPTP
jgi:hypothetical protein